MNLPESIKTKIAESMVRLIAPAIILSMAFAGIAMYVTGDRQYYRLIPGIIAAFAMLPAWILVERGRPKAGATLILLTLCLAIFSGMIFSGGVNAPAYIASIACLTMFSLLYGIRGA